jgi:hypothetical protein
MVATDDREELQFTDVVKSCLLPSLKVPVAVNGCLVPAATVGFAGATIMAKRVAFVMVNRVEPLTEPTVATIVD